MKKLTEIAERTGIKSSEVKKIFGISLIGFIISFFSGCTKNEISQNEVKQDNKKPSNLKELSDSVKKSTDSIIDTSDKLDDSCGPTPGYPCGTRYYTVSIKDFPISPVC